VLFIKRHLGETVVIGNVRVTVTKTGNTVELGIEAPAETPVHRAEVLEQRADHATDTPAPVRAASGS